MDSELITIADGLRILTVWKVNKRLDIYAIICMMHSFGSASEIRGRYLEVVLGKSFDLKLYYYYYTFIITFCGQHKC